MRSPNSFNKLVERLEIFFKSTCVANHCSVSRQRIIVGPTAPSATLIVPRLRSTIKQHDATEMTIAFRTPTFAYPCQPLIIGKVAETINSPGRRAFRLTPSMKSWMATSRDEVSVRKLITASRALSTGSASPAGEHVPRFPPIEPAARI